VECDYVCKNLGEAFAAFSVNGNELAGIQCRGESLQVGNGGVSAGVGVDEVDRRVAAEGGDVVTAEVVGVISVEIAEPLGVDDVDRSGGALEAIDESVAGILPK
jgi:hypothetical protein